jgi:HEAT repeat protein
MQAMQQAERTSRDPVAVGRTAADVSSLLVELGRVLKGWHFYPPEHPTRRELVDRAWRAWSGELRRSGPLGLEIRRGAFWLPGGEAPIGRGEDTARQLYVRSVRRVVFDPELDAATFAAFLDVLATDPEALEAQGGFEAVFYAEARKGIQVNEADWRSLVERARARSDAADEAGEEEPIGTFVTDDDTLPGRPAGAAEAGGAPAGASAGAGLEQLLGTLGAAAQQAFVAPDPAEPVDPRSARRQELASALAQLEECDDELPYRDLARHVVLLATSCAEDGDLDDAYHAVLLLSHHAGDDAKRSYAQRETAIGFLGQLVVGPVLEDLVGRAVAPGAETSLEATAALREIGGRAAPVVLDKLETESDPERRGRLVGVLIAMGEEAVPSLAESIVQGSRRRMRVALRAAGETQNPRLVASLREALLAGPGDVARDAAQALVRIGDVSALEVLTEALGNARPDTAALAAYSLGTTGRVLALAPLTEALSRSLAAGELGFAREVVRSLGRLGRAEAVPGLAALLDRGGLLRRKRLRDLKLAVVSALTHLPGRDAEQALVRAARSRDARLREGAQAALRRRASEAGDPRRGPDPS